MFVLRPDGQWVDFNAYASKAKPEAMDEIVFTTTTQIMEAFGKLFGSPRVLPEVAVPAWIATIDRRARG